MTMFDLTRGPFVVAVAQRLSSLPKWADIEPKARPFDMIQVDLDLLPSPIAASAASACQRMEASGTPVIVCMQRSPSQSAARATRLGRLRDATAFASWVDIEYSGGEDAADASDIADALEGRSSQQMIISYYDADRTPPLDWLASHVDWCRAIVDLRRAGNTLVTRPAGVIVKIATRVEAPEDAETLCALVDIHPTLTCIVGLGASPEQQAALATHSLLAYGYLDAPTDSGQLSVREIDQRLRLVSAPYAERRG